MVPETSTTELIDRARRGAMSRRGFLSAAAALGMGAGEALFLWNAGVVAAAGDYHNGFVAYQAADGTPSASPAATAPGRPQAGTEHQQRGEGGELKLLQWQAPTQLSPHVSSGTKDYLAASPVLEPLMHYTPDALVIPNLVTDVPAVENGMLANDLTWVELHLLPDVTWSDGAPFTADDVAFTIDWVKKPDNNSVNYEQFMTISKYEVKDPLTIRVTFAQPNPFWNVPFCSTTTGMVYPKHILEGGTAAHDAFQQKPIGTGPFMVESFSPGDSVTYVMNPNYREPNKPFFSKISLKGGGDPAAAARAVLQTGEYDYAWYLQAELDVLKSMEKPDGPGHLIPYPGATVERLNLNFADPNKEVDGQRAEMHTPHPYWTDPKVREAAACAIDRKLILDRFYGPDMEVAVNLVQGDKAIMSPNTSWSYDPDKANKILDEAGWVKNGDVREKDGVQLKLTYATETNALSQKTQAIVKKNLEAIGFKVELLQVESGMYYDNSAGNDQNTGHFYRDMQMYKSVPSSPRPISFMAYWYAGPDGRNIAQKSNGWARPNTSRYQSADFDALYEAALKETDADKLVQLFIQINDHLINQHVIIPLIRVGTPRGASRKLVEENIALAAFSHDYWNIANWRWTAS